MGAEQAGDGARHEQDVDGVDAGDEPRRGKVAAEQQRGEVRTDQRDRLGDRVGDAQAGARQQVVGQRVAEHAVDQDEAQQAEADHPVEAPRAPVGAGEEHAEQVGDEGRGEHQGGPVVHLADDQAGAHVEAQAQDRVVGLGHADPAQRPVAAQIDGRGGRGLEEQAHVHPGDHEDDEAVQGDLAEEERPVVGKDVAQLPADEAATAGGVVEPAGHVAVPVARPDRRPAGSRRAGRRSTGGRGTAASGPRLRTGPRRSRRACRRGSRRRSRRGSRSRVRAGARCRPGGAAPLASRRRRCGLRGRPRSRRRRAARRG